MLCVFQCFAGKREHCLNNNNACTDLRTSRRTCSFHSHSSKIFLRSTVRVVAVIGLLRELFNSVFLSRADTHKHTQTHNFHTHGFTNSYNHSVISHSHTHTWASLRTLTHNTLSSFSACISVVSSGSTTGSSDWMISPPLLPASTFASPHTERGAVIVGILPFLVSGGVSAVNWILQAVIKTTVVR